MSIEKEVGRLQGDVISLKENYKEMDAKIDKLLTAADEQRGARRALHFIYVLVIAAVTLKFGAIKALFGGM